VKLWIDADVDDVQLIDWYPIALADISAVDLYLLINREQTIDHPSINDFLPRYKSFIFSSARRRSASLVLVLVSSLVALHYLHDLITH
jgi:hypothetical protein